jgi:23S rRNA (adenine2503-C2)-methyltransferase
MTVTTTIDLDPSAAPDRRTASPRRLLTDLSRAQFVDWCAQHGQPAYRADQVRKWVYGKRVADFAAMHDLPAALRGQLAADFDLFASEIVRHQVASDRTEKLLLRLHDGEHIECVLMREPERVTVCISTQVGCAMGCVFCASGLMGVKRNLSTGEILDQILRLDRLLPLEERITNVVVMGMGEPLANLRNLLPALETLNEKGGMGLGARRITVSTVGLPDRMREFAACGHQYNLAVSLHAPNDELRNRIVPVNDKIGIAAILAAADEFFDRTGRRVTYEYVLLSGLNDEPEHARELAGLLNHAGRTGSPSVPVGRTGSPSVMSPGVSYQHGRTTSPSYDEKRNAHINVIPMNAVAPLSLHGSSHERTERFVEVLREHGVNVTVRKRKGADIDAACGQLRLREEMPGNTDHH